VWLARGGAIVVMPRPALIKMPPVQAMPLRVPAFILGRCFCSA